MEFVEIDRNLLDSSDDYGMRAPRQPDKSTYDAK